MKKVLTFLCCFGIVVSSLLYGGSIFCRNIISHSLVDVAIEQIHLEEKISDILSAIDLPNAQANAALIDAMIEEVVNDEEVIKEVNKFTDSFVADLVNDNPSPLTSNLNQAIKDKVISYAEEISAWSNHLISEESISTILSESVDIANVQGFYEQTIAKMKTEFSPTQKLMLKLISFMQSDACHYLSLIGMFVFTILIFVLNLAWLNGLVPIAVSFLISAITMFIISKLIPVILSMAFSNEALSSGISDNVSQLTTLSIVYFVIFIASTIVKVVYNKIFIKE